MSTKNIYNNLNSMDEDSAKQRIKKIYKKRFYYFFVMFVLIFALLQVGRASYLNIKKYIVLKEQFHKLESINSAAKDKNMTLRKQTKDYTSKKGIEALARDNLKMVGKDEVLVVIKQPFPADTTNKN